jgi:hypothetical protein
MRWSSKIWRFLLIFFGVQIFIFFVLLIIIGYFQIGLDFMDRYQPALGFWVALYVKVAIALQIGLLLVFFCFPIVARGMQVLFWQGTFAQWPGVRNQFPVSPRQH